MEPIAIIGMGCLLPGSHTPDQFYRSILNQETFLEEDFLYTIKPDDFDVPIEQQQYERLDEIFINTLYVVHEALKSSGYLNNRAVLEQSGLVVGSRETVNHKTFELFEPLYLNELEKHLQALLEAPGFRFEYRYDAPRSSPLNIFHFSYPTLLAAKTLSIQGPAFAIEAACSSSIYAINLAANYLHKRQAELMVAGGIFFGKRNRALPHFLRQLGVSPRKSRNSFPLDKKSEGMLANEGGGVVVLKRLADAVRDRDTIHGVIEHIGWSNDGKGKSLLAPAKKGQIAAYQDAYPDSAADRADPSAARPVIADVDYIECHATGTKAGDAVELNSLEDFYGRQAKRPLFGALKGNIGHLLNGSGIASLIKVLFSMKSGVIPATVNVTDPLSSRNGVFSGANMVTQNTPWPDSERARRAAINAFGFGGTNAHLVVRQYLPGNAAEAQEGQDPPDASAPLAIAGMAVHFGGKTDKKAFADLLYYGKKPVLADPAGRLHGLDQNDKILNRYLSRNKFGKGYYFSAFDFDFLKHHIRPQEETEAFNKEMMMLKVAGQALEDAGYEKGPARNVAVIIGAEQSLFQMRLYLNAYLPDFIQAALEKAHIDLSPQQIKQLISLTRHAVVSRSAGADFLSTVIGPIVATRIAATWNLTGPVFKISEMENSFLRSIELAQLLLANRSVEAVLVGALDAQPLLETLAWYDRYGKAVFGLDPKNLTLGEGAVALLLKRPDAKSLENGPVYATIDSLRLWREDTTRASSAQLSAALKEAGKAGYLEVNGDYAALGTEAFWHRMDDDLAQTGSGTIGSGSAAFNCGYTHMTSQALSILKSALMLNCGFRAPVPKFLEHLSTEDVFKQIRMTSAPSYWLDAGKARKVAVRTTGFSGTRGQVILGGFERNDISDAETATLITRPRARTSAAPKLALVYPPTGLNSPFALYELLSSFPRLNALMDALFKKVPTRTKTLFRNLDADLRRPDLPPLFMDGILGNMLTQLILGDLGTNPDSFIGCSFGELVMYTSSGILVEQEHADFMSDLVVPLIAKLSDSVFVKTYFNDPLLQWATFFCKGPRRKISDLLQRIENSKRVFATIKGSPRQLIISGSRQDCEHLVKASNCFAYQISRDFFVHTPLAMKFYDEIVQGNFKHPFQIKAISDCTYYKAYACAPFGYDKKEFAYAIADCICRPIDFTAIIEKAYLDGVRLFIGMDTGNLCAAWISETLDGKDKEVLSIKQKDMSYRESVDVLGRRLRELGATSGKVPAAPYRQHRDREAENSGKPKSSRAKRSFVRIVTNEFPKYKDAILTPENQKLFSGLKKNAAVLPPFADKTPRFGPLRLWKQRLVQKKLEQNNRIYATYLGVQNQLLQLLEDRLDSETVLPAGALYRAGRPANKKLSEPFAHKPVIWDQAAIREMTAGKLSAVLGARYEEADNYPIRSRLPLPPFMFVSRVTDVEAAFGELRPSMIEIEYDIPEDAWFGINGRIPFSIINESSHCGLLLFGYIGVDLIWKGRLRYRAIDSTVKVHDDRMLCLGETVRGVFRIRSFVQSANIVLTPFTYDLFDAQNTLMFTIKGTGGFFSGKDLETAKGVLPSQSVNEKKERIQNPVTPILKCSKTTFCEEDIVNLQNGRADLCFGRHYPVYDGGEQIFPERFKILSRITGIDNHGGAHGLGFVAAEADIDPDHWIFDVHFKNDPVLPATFIIEGGIQVLSFFAHYLGLNKMVGLNSSRSAVAGAESASRFRGEVKRERTTLRFECSISNITIRPETTISADIQVLNQGRVVTITHNMMMKLSENQARGSEPAGIFGSDQHRRQRELP